LRLIKENTFEFESFFESLQNVTEKNCDKGNYSLFNNDDPSTVKTLLSKYSHFFQNISNLQNLIDNCENIKSILDAFESTIKRIITVKEIDFYFYEKTSHKFIPLKKNQNVRTNKFINHANNEGILDWIYENNEPTIIPDTNVYKANGSLLNYLVFPIIEQKRNKGILTLLTPMTSISAASIEILSIKQAIGLVFPRLQLQKYKSELKSVYGELQTYQSKLSKNFKLSAIGELTEGIIENIVSPLQIIVSYTDLLQQKYGGKDSATFNSIKNQVKVIDSMITRLVKFSSTKRINPKICSCDVNKLILEYFELIKGFFKNKNYECILDLENDLPTILSQPDYLNQILTNIFSMVRSNMSEGGGLLIQSKHVKNHVTIRIISTDYIKCLTKKTNEIDDPGFTIIQNLMKKHEGKLSFHAQPATGSHILLSFPLKRKMQK
jgi:K+-sensing histidine kinase KdpD